MKKLLSFCLLTASAVAFSQLYVPGGSSNVQNSNNNNVGIGTNTPSNDQGWGQVLDIFSAPHAKLLVRSASVKTGIFSHEIWGGTVGRIGTESNHDLRLMAGYGNDIMSITTTGNVGIGTTNPQSKLEIYGGGDLALKGATSDAGDIIFQTNTGQQLGRIWSNPNGGIYFSGLDNTAKMAFNNNGNVGIGTVAPQAKLDVIGDIFSTNDTSEGGTLSLLNNNKNIYRWSIYNMTGQYGNSLQFWNYGKNGSANSRVTFTDEGNVGIGTTNPQAKLGINGSFRVFTGNNEFSYNGAADIIFRYSERGSGGRAIVHDNNNTLVINYGGDYTGGVRIGDVLQVNNTGNASLQGKLEAKEVKVVLTPTADFVFDKNYTLPKLQDIEKYVTENHHLPEVASASEMKKNGVNIGEFQIKLLQKIEELTLYTIEQNKKLEEQNKEIQELKNKMKQLKQK